jgi:exonuclease III
LIERHVSQRFNPFSMRIATWNVERLKNRAHLNEITEILDGLDADVLVLTETDSRIALKNYTRSIFSTPPLIEIASEFYKPTENRTTIWSKFPANRQFETYDRYTSLCVELHTTFGPLRFYGTIIGIYGNRKPPFKEDLSEQLKDFRRLAAEDNLCVLGDLNISFADSYYHTEFGRNVLDNSFSDNRLNLLTRDVAECIDHIAISQKIVQNSSYHITEWNIDKRLSDHKGIMVSFETC